MSCSFLQLAQDEGSPVRGFGVVEYESAEQAEAVLIEMDRTLVGGQEVRLSLCTPGTSGRSTLAALIAAQGMVSILKKETSVSKGTMHIQFTQKKVFNFCRYLLSKGYDAVATCVKQLDRRFRDFQLHSVAIIGFTHFSCFL